MIASFVSLILGMSAALAASAAEAAAFALPLADVESLVTRRRRGARSLLSLRLRPAALLATDRKSTRLNSSHMSESRMPSSA